MTDPDPIVFIVDDDLSVRRSTERLIRSAGFNYHIKHRAHGTMRCLTKTVGSPRRASGKLFPKPAPKAPPYSAMI
jgi:hypothetical protein